MSMINSSLSKTTSNFRCNNYCKKYRGHSSGNLTTYCKSGLVLILI